MSHDVFEFIWSDCAQRNQIFKLSLWALLFATVLPLCYLHILVRIYYFLMYLSEYMLHTIGQRSNSYWKQLGNVIGFWAI